MILPRLLGGGVLLRDFAVATLIRREDSRHSTSQFNAELIVDSQGNLHENSDTDPMQNRSDVALANHVPQSFVEQKQIQDHHHEKNALRNGHERNAYDQLLMQESISLSNLAGLPTYNSSQTSPVLSSAVEQSNAISDAKATTSAVVSSGQDTTFPKEEDKQTTPKAEDKQTTPNAEDKHSKPREQTTPPMNADKQTKVSDKHTQISGSTSLGVQREVKDQIGVQLEVSEIGVESPTVKRKVVDRPTKHPLNGPPNHFRFGPDHSGESLHEDDSGNSFHGDHNSVHVNSAEKNDGEANHPLDGEPNKLTFDPDHLSDSGESFHQPDSGESFHQQDSFDQEQDERDLGQMTEDGGSFPNWRNKSWIDIIPATYSTYLARAHLTAQFATAARYEAIAAHERKIAAEAKARREAEAADEAEAAATKKAEEARKKEEEAKKKADEAKKKEEEAKKKEEEAKKKEEEAKKQEEEAKKKEEEAKKKAEATETEDKTAGDESVGDSGFEPNDGVGGDGTSKTGINATGTGTEGANAPIAKNGTAAAKDDDEAEKVKEDKEEKDDESEKMKQDEEDQIKNKLVAKKKRKRQQNIAMLIIAIIVLLLAAYLTLSSKNEKSFEEAILSKKRTEEVSAGEDPNALILRDTNAPIFR